MNKNKKLIALISAMAMIFSLFTSFAVVRAEGEGMTLQYDANASTATKTVVNVIATGYADLSSYTVNLTFPTTVTAAKASYSLITGEENYDATTGAYGYSAAAVSNVAVPGNGVILTIEMTGTVAEDFQIQLTGKSAISDGTTKLGIQRNNLTITPETIPVYVDPNATPTPTPKVPVSTKAPKITPTPVATTDPSVTTAPTKTPVTVDQGMKLEYDEAASTAEKAVLNVIAVGYADLSSYTVNLTFPTDVTAAKASYSLITGEENYDATTGAYGYSAAAVSNVAVPSNGVILTIELTGVTDDFDTTLTGKSAISDGTTKLGIQRNNLPLAWATVKAYTTPDETPTPTTAPTPIPQKAETVEASDLVDASKITGETKDAEGDSNFRLGIKVTDKAGNDVTDTKYGTDDGYVATVTDKDGNDVELTKDEFSNLINGYISALPEELGVTSVADAIGKLKFKPYNTGMTFTAQIIDADNKVVDSGEDTPKDIGGGSTPSKPNVAANDVKVTVDKNFDITATVSNYADKTNPKVKFELTDAKGTVLTAAGLINIYGQADNVFATADKAVTSKTVTQKFTANKTGTAYVTVTYTDDEGNTAAKTVKVTISKASDGGNGGGGSSSSSKNTSSGGNVIASGNQSTLNGSGMLYPDVTFTDLGNVEWAQEAISTLAHNGVISGRDANTFDPDANITRAEYCQILINAIGKQNDYADTSFNDVPTDAWFYHNVAVASQLGIVSGYGDGNFGPYDLITREQMALMTQKAAQVIGKSLAAQSSVIFTDDAAIADWSKAAVYELANAGIINGMGDGTFAPKNNATRAQAAVIIYQIVK